MQVTEDRLKSLVKTMFCLLSLVLQACAPPTASDTYEDYLSRIARTLNVDRPVVTVEPLQAFPARRDLKLAEPTLNMELLDFLRLQDCGLQQLIAQRNSSLGKVMPESQRLFYEYRLMSALDQCLRNDSVDAETQAWMRSVLEHKHRIRQQVFWNSVIASPEMGRFFSPSEHVLDVADSEERQDIQRALAQLMAWQNRLALDGAFKAAPLIQDVEQAYQTLGNEQYAGQLLQSALLAKAWIEAGTQLIHQSLDRQPLCPQGRETPRSRVMQTIMNKFFVGKIQPHLARIQRELQALQQQFDIVKIDTPPAAYIQYRQRYLAKQALPQQYTQAVVQHVRAWQRLLKQCGAMPTR